MVSLSKLTLLLPEFVVAQRVWRRSPLIQDEHLPVFPAIDMLANHLVSNCILDAEHSQVDSVIPLNPVACPLLSVEQCSLFNSKDGDMLLCFGLSFQSQLSLAMLDLVPWRRLTSSGHHADVHHLGASLVPSWALVTLPVLADASPVNQYTMIIVPGQHHVVVLHDTALCFSICLQSGQLTAVSPPLSRSSILGVQDCSFVVLENAIVKQLVARGPTAAPSELDQIADATKAIVGSRVPARATSLTHENTTQLDSSASSSLVFGLDEEDEDTTLEEFVEGQLHFMCHAEHFLFVRSAPNTSTGAKIAQLHYNDQVEVTGRLGQWLRLNWPSEVGASTAWALAVATDQHGLKHLMLCPLQRIPRPNHALINGDMAVQVLSQGNGDHALEGGTVVQLTLAQPARIARLKLAIEVDERHLLNVTTMQLLLGQTPRALDLDLRACQIAQVTLMSSTNDCKSHKHCRWTYLPLLLVLK